MGHSWKNKKRIYFPICLFVHKATGKIWKKLESDQLWKGMRKWWNKKGTSLFTFGIFWYLSQVNVWIIQTLNWKIILEAKDIFSVHTCCLVSEDRAPRRFESCQTACSVVPGCQLSALRGWFVWSQVWHLRLNRHPGKESKKFNIVSVPKFLCISLGPTFSFFFGHITWHVMNSLFLHCTPPPSHPHNTTNTQDK